MSGPGQCPGPALSCGGQLQESERISLLTIAQDAAAEAGELLRAAWRDPQLLPDKGFRDRVTESDFAAQRLLTEAIGNRFPEHGFLAEEADETLSGAGRVVWIIDPIDGTSNFSRRQPNFCISLAAMAEERVQVGVIYDPIRDEMFSATAGRATSLNGQPVSVSPLSDLAEAVVALDWSHSREKRQLSMEMLSTFAHRVHSIRAIGSAALALAWVAAGRLDAYLNASLEPWDMAAGALLIRQAGGKLTDWQGHDWHPHDASGARLASNGQIHDWLLSPLSTL